MDERFLLGNRGLAPSSTVVVDQLSPHGRGGRELVSRAEGPDYSIRRAFDFE